MRPAAVVVLTMVLSACSSSTAPAPSATKETATTKVDVSGIPSQLKVLTAPGGAAAALAAEFDRWLNAQAAPGTFHVTVIEVEEDKLIGDLLAGKGDMAANLLLTFERDDQVAFAKPVRTGIKEIVVTSPGQPPMVSLEDIGGREIHVRKSSDHYASVVRLNEQLRKINRPPAKIVLLPSSMTDEAVLESMAANGKIPATVVDDYVFEAKRAKLPNLNANRDVAVSQDGQLAWVTRKDSPRLLAVMNEFFSKRLPAP